MPPRDRLLHVRLLPSRWLAAVAAVLLASSLLAVTTSLAQEQASVDVRDDFFEPDVVEVTVGGTVTWTHTGANPHSVTAFPDQGEDFDSHPDCTPQTPELCMQQGDEFAHTFAEEGWFPYFCKIHGPAGMAAGVLVTEEADSDDTDGEDDGAQQQPQADPEGACPDDPPPADYTDRDDIPEVHVRNVDCVTSRNIAVGFTDGSYGPALPVTRDGMASFIARTLTAAGIALPPPDEHDGFDDTAGNDHEDSIRRLAAAGIVLGGPGDLPANMYGPRELTRRDQMASFLIRAASWAFDQDFGEDDQRFPDVPSANPHFRSVNGAHELGLTMGRPDGTYQPGADTRRDQMASFLSRLLNFLETFQEPADDPAEPTPEPTPTPTPDPTPEPPAPPEPAETYTAAPELTLAQHVTTTAEGHVDVRFIFDRDIGETVVAEQFHLHTAGGDNIRGTDGEREAGTTDAVVIRFAGAEADLPDVTVAAVDREAVIGDDPAEVNPEGSVHFPFVGGETVAPVLAGVVIGAEDNGTREIVFTFDTALDDGQAIAAGDFSLYDEDGSRTGLSDCAYSAEDDTEVVCTVTQSPFAPIITDPEFEAAEDAVLAGVAGEVVTPDAPPAGADPQNHAAALPVT